MERVRPSEKNAMPRKETMQGKKQGGYYTGEPGEKNEGRRGVKGYKAPRGGGVFGGMGIKAGVY